MKWQPMKSAPSGTMILICSMAAHQAEDWCFVDWLVGGKLVKHPKHTATHWMPLPAPPK